MKRFILVTAFIGILSLMTFAISNTNQTTLTESNWIQSQKEFSFISESTKEIMFNIATEKDGVENQYHLLSGGATPTDPGTNGEDDEIWVFVFNPSLIEL